MIKIAVIDDEENIRKYLISQIKKHERELFIEEYPSAEPERIKDTDMTESVRLGAVTEPEFQYGAEAFENYQETENIPVSKVVEPEVSEVKGKSR